MTIEIVGQFRFLLLTLCLGMLYICGYDALRFFRWLFPHGKVMLWVEDILYWCIVSVPGFYLFFLYNDGIIRWYGITSVFCGALLYELGLSRPVRKACDRAFTARKRRFFLRFFHLKQKFKENLKKKMKKTAKNYKKILQNKKKKSIV